MEMKNEKKKKMTNKAKNLPWYCFETVLETTITRDAREKMFPLPTKK